MQAIVSTAALQFHVIALIGMLAHSVIKWLKGEIIGNVVDWYLDNPRMSVAALLSVVGSTMMMLLNGVLSDITVGAQVIAAFGVGYGFDSGVNKQ